MVVREICMRRDRRTDILIKILCSPEYMWAKNAEIDHIKQATSLLSPFRRPCRQSAQFCIVPNIS